MAPRVAQSSVFVSQDEGAARVQRRCGGSRPHNCRGIIVWIGPGIEGFLSVALHRRRASRTIRRSDAKLAAERCVSLEISNCDVTMLSGASFTHRLTLT